MEYNTKNSRKIKAWIQGNRYRLMRVREISRETGIAASSVLYQLRVITRSGLLVCRARMYLFRAMVPGAMWKTFCSLVRHTRNLNKGLWIELRRQENSEKRILPQLQLVSPRNF